MKNKNNPIEIRALGIAILDGAPMVKEEIDHLVEGCQLFERIRNEVLRGRAMDRNSVRDQPSLLSQGRLVARFAATAFALGTALILGNIWMALTTEMVDIPAIVLDDLKPAPLEPDLTKHQRGFVSATRKSRRTEMKKRAAQPSGSDMDADQSPFVRVAFTGEEDIGSDRIIRVELPRTSLFAMGVNVPVENERDHAKADLLLASDGTVKGVRLARL